MMELLEKAKFVFVAYLRLRCVESTSVVTKRSQSRDNQNCVRCWFCWSRANCIIIDDVEI